MQKRQVQIVFLKYLDGVFMDQIDARVLRKKQRTNILRKAIEAESVIYHAGVQHSDFSPRNILLHDFNIAGGDLKVKLVDFDAAGLRPLERDVHQHKELMENPAARFWL